MWRLVAATVVASTITFTQIAYAAERDWTGFYSGVNIGYSWGDASTDITGNGTTTVVAGIVPGFPGFFSSFGFADSNTARLDGVIGGAQIGFNFQLNSKWLLGLEADIQASDERGSNTFTDPFSEAYV
jgi:outer membrane immunogenic protein